MAETLAYLGQASHPGERESRDRVIALVRRQQDAESLAEFVDRNTAIDQQRAVVALDDLRALVLLNVRDDGLQDVPLGDDALDAAVLIDDQNQVEWRLA